MDISSYPFAATTGIPLEDMTGATKMIGIHADDTRGAVYPIGFDFWLAGTRFEAFSVTANGMFRLGRIPAATLTYGIGEASTYVAAYVTDTSTSSHPNAGVFHRLQGSEPNRRLIVSWRNMLVPFVWNTTPFAPQLNEWQVVLHETTGQVEFRYGSGIVPTPRQSTLPAMPSASTATPLSMPPWTCKRSRRPTARR